MWSVCWKGRKAKHVHIFLISVLKRRFSINNIQIIINLACFWRLGTKLGFLEFSSINANFWGVFVRLYFQCTKWWIVIGWKDKQNKSKVFSLVRLYPSSPVKVPNKWRVRKNLGSSKIFGSTECWVRKNCGSKKTFSYKNICGWKKIFMGGGEGGADLPTLTWITKFLIFTLQTHAEIGWLFMYVHYGPFAKKPKAS